MLSVFQLRQKFQLLSLTRIDNNKTRSNKTVPTHNMEVIFLSPDQFHLQEHPRRRSRRRWGSWPRGTPWQHYIFGTVGQQTKKGRNKKTFLLYKNLLHPRTLSVRLVPLASERRQLGRRRRQNVVLIIAYISHKQRWCTFPSRCTS